MTSIRRIVVLVLLVAVLAGCAQAMMVSIEALLKQGIELFTAGKYDAAIAKFLEVLQRDPKSWNAYLYLARSYLAKGAWSDAIASGRKALELGDKNEVVPVLGEALFKAAGDALSRRQFSEAVGHLVEYVQLKPTDWQGYLQLGRAYLGAGTYGNALQTFVQGLTQTSDASGRQQLLRGLLDGGVQALGAGNPRAAIGLIQEYIRHDPRNASAYLELGKAFWKDGSYSGAFTAFQRVLELKPDDPEALQFLRFRR
jgi:tetratricopeptide (TPR) repeat protein